jgi:S-DNA-T family DNA segregation ATPase FtsK/SpoIIIE
MVDPAVIELRIFNSLPHMLIPVVTDPQKVPAVLMWLLSEMQQRFQIFALVNASNIAGFNNRQRTSPISSRNDDIELPDRLPHVVLIINELADPMIAAAAETESLIARIAQHGGTAGIHLIIATQRPSADVVTDVIKSSLPVRVAFKVGSQLDSRAILGVRGAETLIGRGDSRRAISGSKTMCDSRVSGCTMARSAANSP